jgi:hypothetical protein
MGLIKLLLPLLSIVRAHNHSELILQVGCFFCDKIETKYDQLGCINVCTSDWGSSKASFVSADSCTAWVEDQMWREPKHSDFAQNLINDYGYCFSFDPRDALKRRLDSIDCANS